MWCSGFVEVDCHEDIDAATQLVEGTFREVFETAGELRFRVRGQLQVAASN
jgi:hypothetical protein